MLLRGEFKIKKFNTIFELQLYLSVLPIGLEKIEVELVSGEHQLHETWIIQHRLELNACSADECKIFGDVNLCLIHIKNHVQFKNISIQRGLKDDQSVENGSTIVVDRKSSFVAEFCIIHAYQHDHEHTRYAGVELKDKAKAVLNHCSLIGNHHSIGVWVKAQDFKRRYKYDAILNDCHLVSHMMGICVEDDARIKINRSVIENSFDNAIYQLGEWIEINDVQVMNSGRHGLSLVNGKGLIKKMLIKETHFSAISTYLKCHTDQIEQNINFNQDFQADLVIEDLEVDKIGLSAIFLSENSTVIAKKILVHAVDEVAFKCTACSKLYLEDVIVKSCIGCSLIGTDLSQIIAKKVKFSAGNWGAIYLDVCASLFLDDPIENISGLLIDLAGDARIELGTHNQEMLDFLRQAQDRKSIWDLEIWLRVFKDRSNRFDFNTRKRIAYLFKALTTHLDLEPFIFQWGRFGEKALYPLWLKLGCPRSIVFDAQQVLKHRFDCVKKETKIQACSFLEDEIIGLSIVDQSIFVFTHSYFYQCEIDEKTDDLIVFQKQKLWGNDQPLLDCKIDILDIISQNQKHYLIFEYEGLFVSRNMMLLIYDEIKQASQYFYMERDSVGFYPQDDQIITFGWHVDRYPSKNYTWMRSLTSTDARVKIADQTIIPQGTWLWHKYQRKMAFLKNEYQIEIVNRKINICDVQTQSLVYEVPQANLYHFVALDPYVLCANQHELWIIKKI